MISRKGIRRKRKEIRKVNCSEPMDNSVTEDKVINPRTAKLFQLTFAAKGGLLQPPGF